MNDIFSTNGFGRESIIFNGQFVYILQPNGQSIIISASTFLHSHLIQTIFSKLGSTLGTSVYFSKKQAHQLNEMSCPFCNVGGRLRDQRSRSR